MFFLGIFFINSLGIFNPFLLSQNNFQKFPLLVTVIQFLSFIIILFFSNNMQKLNSTLLNKFTINITQNLAMKNNKNLFVCLFVCNKILTLNFPISYQIFLKGLQELKFMRVSADVNL